MPGYELIGKEERDAVNKIFDDGGILFHRAFENVRKNFYVREVGTKFENTLIPKIALPYLQERQLLNVL